MILREMEKDIYKKVYSGGSQPNFNRENSMVSLDDTKPLVDDYKQN